MATTPISNAIALLAPDGSTLTDDFINGLVQGGAWTWGQFDPQVLTYSLNINDNGFPEGDPNLAPGPGGTWVANPAMAAAVSQALSAWSNVANIGFQQVTSGTYSFESGADLAITLTGNDLQTFAGAIGLSFFPDPAYVQSLMDADDTDTLDRTDYPKPEGDVFLDNFSPVFSYLNSGGIGLSVILHEIGHALGLKHTGDDGGNARPLFSDLGIGAYDSMQYTVMTTDIGFLTPGPSGFAATPMPADILAIQRIYGANTSYHAGNDVYTLANDGVLKTIWDAGGTDTFDASALTSNVVLDLHAGAFSWHWTAPGPMGNVSTAIAYNVIIENATGGSGNDVIGGNDASNQLTGGAGSDTVSGFFGDDTLDGGVGGDWMSGGEGDDIYIVNSAADVVKESALSTAFVDQSLSFASISGDGSRVAFLDFPDHSVQQILVRNLATGAIVEASSSSGGTPGNSNSFFPALSTDGRYVAFESGSSNLVPGDTNGATDIFVKDLQTAVLTRVSTASDGTQANGFSGAADVSGNGRYVVFQSGASNLAPDDAAFLDIFLKDLESGTTTLVSTDPAGIHGNGNSRNPDLSADARYVVFESDATNLVSGLADTNNGPDLFRKDLLTGETVLVSSSSSGALPTLQSNPSFFQFNGSTLGAVSGDGRYVVFNSVADNLVPGDTNGQIDVFVKDLQTGTTVRASTASGGGQANNGSNGSSISEDGRYVVFDSIATNLDAGDTDAAFDVYVKDLQTGQTALISAPATGVKVGGGTAYSLSADGHYVVFNSSAGNLVAGNLDGTSGGVFVANNPLFDPGGTDEVRSSVNYALGAHLERLTLTGTEDINGAGNESNNLIVGNGGANSLNGGAGNDTLMGGQGIDSLAGGAGNDTEVVSVSATAGPSGIVFVPDVVTENLSDGIDTVFSSASYALPSNVENLVLTGAPFWHAYTGTGNGLNNVLTGQGSARHILDGGAGNDTLIGGTGIDVLTGGTGSDVFLFNSVPSADKILDFASGTDHIDLDKAIYTAFGTPGAVSAQNAQTGLESAITASSGNPGDGQDYLKYASDTGHLYYDADGTGAGGLSLIATLYSGGTTPAALLPTQDILIV